METNQIIEELMLLANKAVAEYITEKKNLLIYRNHEDPALADWKKFLAVLEGLGLWKSGRKKSVSINIQKVLEKIPDDQEQVVHELLLRTMKKAVYEAENKGHFGLGFSSYVHFTSPIRRYADLMVHRILAQTLDNKKPEHAKYKIARKLKRVADHISKTEQNAQSAERASVKIKLIAFMAERVGEEYWGSISGVQSFGIFVLLDEVWAEGFVHVRDLDDDYYQYREQLQQLQGARKKRSYRLGDRILVQVVRVDKEKKEVDLRILDRK